jgi:hippurate hydrolase
MLNRMTYKDLAVEANQYLTVLQGIRRELHQIPEFGLETYKTLERTLASVDGLGEIHHSKKVAGAALHIKGAQPGPTVLIRADLDALAVIEDTGLEYASTNGYMHACGHDLHAAMGVGAAHLLRTHADLLKGDVVVFFQPGEEGHGGADIMLEEGLHLVSGQKPIASYGLHVFSAGTKRGVFTTKAGPMMASAGDMIVTFHGQGGHGSSPWDSRDPNSALIEAMSALQTLVTKKIYVFDPVVINIGWIHAGDRHTANVIPETASFGATIRTFSEENHGKIRELAKNLMHKIAEGFGLTATVEFSPSSQVVFNDATAVNRVERIVKEVFGDERYEEMPHPIMGGEDMSSILKEMPGAFIFLSAATDDNNLDNLPTNHSNKATFDDSVMPDGSALLASLVIDTLNEAANN